MSNNQMVLAPRELLERLDLGKNTAVAMAALPELRELLAKPAEQHRIHIEVRECGGCNHIGIDDAHSALAACHSCDWSGPEPVEDKCPGCGRENVMAAACPDCGSRYALAASKEFDVPAEQHQGDPVAWIVHTPGSYAPGPKAILRSQYDVESPAFWENGQPPRNAEITRLYPAPPAAPDLCEVVLKILKEAANIPDGLYARAKFLAKNPATHADPAEVDRLRDENRRLHEAGEFLDGVSQGIEDKLRAQLAELTEAFSESQEEVVKRGKMVAERDALLREVRPSCHPKHFAKIDVALSASAEPSAPIAWHVGGNGYDRICFEKPDDLPGRPCIQAIHDQRQLIDLLKRYDLRHEDVPPDERGHGIPGTSFQRLNALANEGE